MRFSYDECVDGFVHACTMAIDHSISLPPGNIHLLQTALCGLKEFKGRPLKLQIPSFVPLSVQGPDVNPAVTCIKCHELMNVYQVING